MTKPTITARGFLFDLDGVLVDSTAAVERHWREFARRHDLEPATVLLEVHGRRSADVIRRLAPLLGAPVDGAIREFEEYDAADQDGVVTLPGAAATLDRLPPGSWAVVTSGGPAVARARLAAAGLPPPALLVTADDVPVGKPAPHAYLLGAARLGLPPAAVVAVEDAPTGLASAIGAGCRTLALLTTHPAADLATADVIAADLTAVELAIRPDSQPVS